MLASAWDWSANGLSMTRYQRGVYKWWWLKRCTTQNKPEDKCMRWDLLVVVLSLYILIFYFLLCELGGKGQLWSICRWLPSSVQHDNSHKKCIDMHPLTLLCTGVLCSPEIISGSGVQCGHVEWYFTSSWEGLYILLGGYPSLNQGQSAMAIDVPQEVGSVPIPR